jgi:para-aminobenzoate synthetase component 1
MKLLYDMIPFSKEKFFERFFQLVEGKSRYALLESGRSGRYSIAGIDPFAVIEGRKNGILVAKKDHDQWMEGQPLRALEQWLKPYTIESVPELPDFQGGLIGFISYDYARFLEKLPNVAKDDLGLPLFYFYFFREWVVFDHESNWLWVMKLAESDDDLLCLESWKKKWQSKSEEREQTKYIDDAYFEDDVDVDVSLSEREFINAVEKIQEYIAGGDVFQVNLSVRQAKSLHVPALEVYKTLRILNPSPYMGYIHSEDFQIVCGSPELLVKKTGEMVKTRPIAGTRSRGKNEEEDRMLESELFENEKERAEHVMLVDLERNDLGRVCQYGTVRVNELMTIEKYSHVMHLVSEVEGKLTEEKNAFDVIEAVFPGGTITGAPKVRTMEIIEELENVRRGVYTGSVGWIGLDGNMHLNIVIRTMIVKNGRAYVQAGAGIVMDSRPQYEYKEALKKAAALWKAKEKAEKKGVLT